MPHTLTLAAIHALSDEALCLALAEQVEGWPPIPHADLRAATGCTHSADDGGFYCVPEYTASWKLCMELWWHKGRNVDIVRFTDGETLIRIAAGPVSIRCTTKAETRRALCELVLWQAGTKEAAGTP